MQLLVVTDDTQVENYAAMPEGDLNSFFLEPHSSEYQCITETLKAIRYSRCLHTHILNWFPQGEGSNFVRIKWFQQNLYCIIAATSSHIVVNGEVFHIDTRSNLYNRIAEVVKEIE